MLPKLIDLVRIETAALVEQSRNAQSVLGWQGVAQIPQEREIVLEMPRARVEVDLDARDRAARRAPAGELGVSMILVARGVQRSVCARWTSQMRAPGAGGTGTPCAMKRTCAGRAAADASAAAIIAARGLPNAARDR